MCACVRAFVCVCVRVRAGCSKFARDRSGIKSIFFQNFVHNDKKKLLNVIAFLTFSSASLICEEVFS